MSNEIKNFWKNLEKNHKSPLSLRAVQTFDVKKFYKLLEDENKVKKLIKDTYSGDFILIKNSIKKNFLQKLKYKLHDLATKTPSEYNPMTEGCPNFHRFIDEKSSKKYSVQSFRHAFYFFRWNQDKLNLFKKFNFLWGSIKKIGGLNFDEYVKNTPKDKIVDRVQVVRYPDKTGFIEPHQHSPKNQRLIISIYMSKKGKDYLSGGTFFYKKNKKIEVEKNIDIGDCGIFYATLKHSVKPVQLSKIKLSAKEEKIKGRWWIGLYSPESNHKKKRNTSRPL